MLRVLAAVFALIAVICMTLAIVGMVTERVSDRVGFAVRLAALLCFGAAVGLNVAAH
jgi:hypothetical protein